MEGVPSAVWDVNGAGDESIQGFASDISVEPAEKLLFKIKTLSVQYRIDIYRLGWYGGAGARLVDTVLPSAQLPQAQPPCESEEATLLYDCGNWEVSATWTPPEDAVSGLYFARPTREDDPQVGEKSNWRADNSPRMSDPIHAIPGVDPYVALPDLPHSYGANGKGRRRNALVEPRASHIWFVVRDDVGRSDILVQTSDATWAAYNGYGGFTTYGSFVSPYTHGPDPEVINVTEPWRRAYKASYNRPMITRGYRAINMPLATEMPLIRFLESNGYGTLPPLALSLLAREDPDLRCHCPPL